VTGPHLTHAVMRPCPECGQPMERHRNEWWCPDDWQFELLCDAAYVTRFQTDEWGAA
jgi:hypothetical protein